VEKEIFVVVKLYTEMLPHRFPWKSKNKRRWICVCIYSLLQACLRTDSAEGGSGLMLSRCHVIPASSQNWPASFWNSLCAPSPSIIFHSLSSYLSMNLQANIENANCWYGFLHHS
jgi:hypothetical protein